MKLIFATNNPHKVEEIQTAMANRLEVISLRQAGIQIDLAEPYDTLEANASAKSMAIHRLTHLDCFSEDTGLEVGALDGEPGVHSARYAGEGSSSAQNIDKLLARLDSNPHRQARFRTILSLLIHEKEYLFEGCCPGTIAWERMGTGGFGYDPIFIPEGSTRSFGQMTAQEKNQYSHRRQAAQKLLSFLQQKDWIR
jgi:XTP/dITP diphosphohydrolase